MNKLLKHADTCRISVIIVFLLVCMTCFVMTQPFGDGPDEINRYKVVSYIQQHGTIPAGYEPEIIIDGYGASYAFQPILTYIIEGFLLRCLSPLHLSFDTELVIARYVNVLFGLIAAFYTYKLSGLLFSKPQSAMLFTLGVTLLPQNIFVYTYVNTDGMALMSCVMMMYSLIRGYRNNFDRVSVITLSVGMALCLLSYYNCYSFILVTAVSFVLYYFFHKDVSKKEMFQKGGIIVAIVSILAGWWFIRNMVLYDGDILALSARSECAQLTGNWYFLEQMAQTYKVQGYSVMDMVFGTDYYTLVWKSFIGMFGPMLIPTVHQLYMAYKYLTVICLLCLIIRKHSSFMTEMSFSSKMIICIGMAVLAGITTVINVIYSYNWDFQPQGRYYLPMLLPLACLLCVGLEKLITLVSDILESLMTNKKASAYASALMYHMFYAFFFLSAAVSVYMMLKYYASTL
ncbi:MAG: hypothetical protein K6G69_03460 [Lachnospiraceae bacterium]|nr:hypothetical protein [Lachnospiraceae bacterium]